jgi:hypothetical protein
VRCLGDKPSAVDPPPPLVSSFRISKETGELVLTREDAYRNLRDLINDVPGFERRCSLVRCLEDYRKAVELDLKIETFHGERTTDAPLSRQLDRLEERGRALLGNGKQTGQKEETGG